MHLARRAWCRTYQMVFRIALPVLPYTGRIFWSMPRMSPRCFKNARYNGFLS